MNSDFHALYIADLSAILIRGWASFPRQPKFVRIVDGETSLARQETFTVRVDLEKIDPNETMFGYTVTIVVTDRAPEALVAEIVDSADSVTRTKRVRVAHIDNLRAKFANPRTVLPDGTLNIVDPFKDLLNLVAGEQAWLLYLRYHNNMRSVISSHHNPLYDDFRKSEGVAKFIERFLEEVFDQTGPGISRWQSLRVLIENKVIATRPDLHSGWENAYGARFAPEPEEAEEGLDAPALAPLIAAAIRDNSVSAAFKYDASLRRQLLGVLANEEGAGSSLKAAAAGADAAVIAAALNDWDMRESFDLTVVRAVLRSSDLVEALRFDNTTVRIVESSLDLTSAFASLGSVQKRVLERFAPAELLPPIRFHVKPPAPPRDPDAAPPRFSIVLGVYNGEEYLQATLDSINQQTFSDYEFIIVDDASTDRTPELIGAYAARHPAVRIIRHELNRGQAAAFNTGVAAAKGEYVALMDADDVWFANKLETCDRFIQIHASIDFIQHNLQLLIDDRPTSRMFRSTLASGDYIQQMYDENLYFPGPFTPTAGLIFSRSVLQRVGPIPVALRTCADGFLTRAVAAYSQVSSMPVALGYYRIHNSNATIGNDEYDVNSYASRVLAPLLQKFYAKTDRRISLPRFTDPRTTKYIRVTDRWTLGQETELDALVKAAIRYIASALNTSGVFTRPFVKLLEQCREMVRAADFQGLTANVLAKAVVADAETPVAKALQCIFQASRSNNEWLKNNVETIWRASPPSVMLSMLAFETVARHKPDEALAFMLAQIEEGALNRAHIKYLRQPKNVLSHPDLYLAMQRALMKSRGYALDYFNEIKWTIEKVAVVDAWQDELKKDASKPRLFSARRTAPPAVIAEQYSGSPLKASGPEEIERRRLGCLDLAGVTVFAGEWYVRTAEGKLVSDAHVSTPHHTASAYGYAAPTYSEFDLIYPEPTVELEPSFLIGGDDNYFHWINDVLPRACWFAQDPSLDKFKALVGAPARRKLRGGRPKASFQSQILGALGLGGDRIVELEYPSVVAVSRLLIPLLGPQSKPFMSVYGTARRWAHNHFGKLVYPEFSTQPWPSRTAGRKIFARRGGADHRTMAMEDLVAHRFAQLGFEIFDSGSSPLAQQVQTFNEASLIVGPHGAALANLAFSRPNAFVLEFAFPTWAPNFFGVIAKARDLTHDRFFMRVAPNPDTLPQYYDGYLPMDEVDEVIERYGFTG